MNSLRVLASVLFDITAGVPSLAILIATYPTVKLIDAGMSPKAAAWCSIPWYIITLPITLPLFLGGQILCFTLHYVFR